MAALTAAAAAAATLETMSTPNIFLPSFPGRSADKYRGAVVEVRVLEVGNKYLCSLLTDVAFYVGLATTTGVFSSGE